MKFTIKINDPMPKSFKKWIEGDYHVSFSRKMMDVQSDGYSTYRIVTTCIIIKKDGGCYFGTTVRNPNDKENAFVARKNAFARAFNQYIGQQIKRNSYVVYEAWARNAFWKAAFESELKELLIPD